jgi:ketosteroid isomerase-like protein
VNVSANVDSVHEFYGAFSKGDLPTVLELMLDDIEWNEPESVPYGSHIGRQAVAENVLARVIDDMPDFSATPEQFIDGGGDIVVTIGTYRGTSRTTNRGLETKFAHIFTLKSGKIARFRTISDTHLWRYALGID